MRSFLPSRIALACIVSGAVSTAFADPKPPEPPPLEIPKPPPAQISSSEGMPPLPYPAVPQKRQEKKNPPQPPTLLTKIKSADAEDWTRTPNDLKGLLEWVSGEMNVHFTSNIKAFGEISGEPTKNPMLYRSGYKPFTLTPAEIAKVREYVLNGGTVVFNSLVGNPDAYKCALKAAQQILPERNVYRLRMDHPIFHSFYNIDKVAYRERMVKDGMVVDQYPYLEGVDVDNRTAIIISRWDFSLGWEANAHDSWGYADTDSRKIGANVVAYCTAMRDAGRSVGKSVELSDSDKKTAGKFRVGQVIHNGPWKTRTAAFPMLLSDFNKQTGTQVSFDLKDIALTDAAIFEMPFLFLTGTTDFALSEQERANLRKFLNNGGVLFVEAGEGRASFDAAFRTEIAQVLPGKQLAPLPANHEIFRQPKSCETVKARPALAAKNGNQIDIAPVLQGVELNGALSVIYSPYDCSAGWERAIAPYAIGYEPQDATAIGLNVLYYAVSH
jgi:hypothetical protein